MARWKKYLIGAGAGVLGLILVVLLAGPPILSSVIRARLQASLQEETTGRVEVASVRFSWFGPVRIEGLKIHDRTGELILDAPRSTVEGSIWNGYSNVSVRVESPVVLVRRYDDGKWNWKEIRRAKEPSVAKEPRKEKRESRAEILITNARIVLASGDRRSELVAQGSGSWSNGELHYDASGEGVRMHGTLEDVEIEAKDFAISKLGGLWDLPDLKANGSATFHVGETITGKGKFDLGPDAALAFQLDRDIFVDGFARLEKFRPGWKGRAEGNLRVDGRRAVGRVTVTDFEASGVRDPKVTIEADADVVRDPLDVTIRDAKVSSTFLRTAARGRWKDDVVHLEGDLWYIPAKLDAVFDLPGEFTGTGEEQMTFAFDAPVRARAFLDFVRAAAGKATVGVGRWESRGIELGGRLHTDAADGVLSLRGGLDVNGGRADLTSSVDARGAEPEYRVVATYEKVQLDPEMTTFLQFLHPMFLEGTSLAGTAQGSVELSYRGDFAAEKLNGRGSIQFTDLLVKEGELLRELGVLIDVGEIRMEPLVFSLREGRVTYEKPLKMKISGQQTTWTGSIGIDGSLDLLWEIPVGPKLIRKYPALERFSGETIRIPVRGTLTSPRVEWQKPVEDLLTKSAGDWLDKLIPDEDAARKLLEEADRLYDEGKIDEAGKLYTQIREKHRKTKVYDRNKDRIKQRMK